MVHTNKKAPAPTKTQDASETNTNGLDFPIDQPQRKEVIEVLNCLSKRGHLVIKGPQNDFHVCKYGYTQYCQDIIELHTFAVRLGVYA
jgi:hypothetical protein